MDLKKVKKSATTLTELVFGLIVFIGVFTGLFLWLNYNITDSGSTMDGRYSEAYNQLNITSSNINENVNDIKNSFEKISEADSSWQVAWNGFKALGETLKLPINFLDSALQAMNITFVSLDYIPEWTKVMIGAMITALIVFLVLALLKGEQRM